MALVAAIMLLGNSKVFLAHQYQRLLPRRGNNGWMDGAMISYSLDQVLASPVDEHCLRWHVCIVGASTVVIVRILAHT